MRLFFCFQLFLFVNLSISQETNYSSESISKELTANANAVVRLDKMEVMVAARDLMKVKSTRIITVLNKKGNRYVQAYAGYNKNRKINKIEAVVYNQFGQEIKKIKKKDFIDVSAVSSGTLYSDARVLYLDYTPISYPYTVVFTKEYTSVNTAFLPSWYFLDGYNVSTEQSEYSIQFNNNASFRHKELNFNEHVINIEITANKISYKGQNLKAYKDEDYSPAFSDVAPRVKVALDHFHLEGVNGTAKTWKEYGKWIYDELIQGRGVVDAVTTSKVKNLVNDIEDPKEKVKAVYEYVQNNTRYISVQLGIGGWMPISAAEVDEVKYGDCKGLTNYTMALLKVVGIESFYTVVFAGRSIKNIDFDFPSLQGNHAILNIPIDGVDTWLECTSQMTPANFISEFTDNRFVLKVKPDGGELVKTLKYSENENYQFTSAEYFLKANGGISGNLNISSKGSQYNRKYRLPVKTEKEKELHYKEYWNYINNIKLDNIVFENDKDDITFKENVSLSATNYATLNDGEILFAPNAFNRNEHVPDRYRTRTQDVVIERGFLDEDEFKIHLPDGFRVKSLPEAIKINSKFGVYAVTIEQESESLLIYKRKWLLKEGRYDKEEYKAFRNFMRSAARYDKNKIILTNI
ncbi:MAG: DUF3857 domain-containing protein [Flavobacteriaceae bacterium]|nr:MAG: DUF3857 domain-containing protein [Flavobacteriaceae bacterium]